MKYDATVAILVLNGEEYLDEVLAAVTTQRTKLKFEVLVIDSGSTDKSVEITRAYKDKGVRLHEIPNTEFGHGKTRNLAVQLAEGDYVVFLTQDATPSHDRWLDYMVEPFAMSDKVVAVFGKQIPRADCFATLKREVYDVFRSFGPDDAVIMHRKTEVHPDMVIANNFMSDVNSAVRKSVVGSTLPFRNVEYAEDQCMGIDVLDKGLVKAFSPLGSVFHSHDYKLGKYFKRKFDEAIGLKESTGHVVQIGLKQLILGTAKASLLDWAFIWRDKDYSATRKLHDFVLAPAYNFANRRAMRLAAHKNLSLEKQQKLSLETSARKKSRS